MSKNISTVGTPVNEQNLSARTRERLHVARSRFFPPMIKSGTALCEITTSQEKLQSLYLVPINCNPATYKLQYLPGDVFHPGQICELEIINGVMTIPIGNEIFRIPHFLFERVC